MAARYLSGMNKVVPEPVREIVFEVRPSEPENGALGPMQEGR